ncbi:hypothetical protein E2562_028336 [Oryza meyeriana var. granulata]|uniref:Uncharacterized protein n=1 Tax=Oryza meyeriana var. granulata TaxID=110450 RepID=A0A6G1FCW9_9ORYZ|nr:hypothetical protein E2562_028336 [Oryza meyeriana var. granulata]
MDPETAVIGRDAGNGGDVAASEERRKVELVQEAIRELLEDKRRERRRRQGGDGGEEFRRDHEEEEDGILSSLLSKVDALQNDAALDEVKPNCFHPNSEDRHEISKDVKLGDIAKDLNKIKRQNMITHILLGTVIVMTAVWQFNVVSFLLAVQKKLSNPFKSLGELIKGSLKGRGKPMIEAPPLPPVGVPDVTRNDLPLLLISNGNGNDDD